MAIFRHPELDKLRDAREVLSEGLATHELALRLLAAGRLPELFFQQDIYEYGKKSLTPSGESYYEISHYWGEQGASIFLLGEHMLYLSRDEQLMPLSAKDFDVDLYLAPLLKGLPAQWDFVVDMLQTQERFLMRPPGSVFWFQHGAWHVTDEYENIMSSSPGDRLFDYADCVNYVASDELGFLFLPSPVTQSSLIEQYFKDWMRDS